MWPFSSSDTPKKQVRILSCNGGGIRGLMSARFLEHLMNEVGSSIQDTFHMFAGNSTGSLIGLTQTRPEPRPVEELADLYHNFGPSIFKNSRTWRVRTNWGLRGPKYPDTGLRAAVEHCAGDLWLSDCVMDFLVPAFDLQTKSGYWFKSWDIRDEDDDFRLADIGLSSASAPTFFPAAKVQSRAGTDRYFADGGVFANNPSLQALEEAKRLYPQADEYLLVSIGTGIVDRRLPAESMPGWGLLSWLSPLIDILQTINDEKLLGEVAQVMGEDPYYRFDLKVNEKHDGVKLPSIALDLASKHNRQRLEDLAKVWIRSSEPEIAELVDRLRIPKVPREALTRA